MRPAIALLLAVSASAAAQQQPKQPPIGIQVTGAHLVRTPPPGILTPRMLVETETEFLTTDPAAFYSLTYTGGHKDDKIRLEWRNPSGALVQQNDHTQLTDGATMRLNWKLPIAGGPASFAAGEWQAVLFWNGLGVEQTSFRISIPPETAVNMVSRSVLPEATVTVPYFVQLSARGGTAPYRWAAVKALPNGLTLSGDGTVSGTPLRRGSYRAILEAKDAAGNSVTRTFGIGIGAIAANDVRATTRNLLKSAGSDACSQAASQTDFSASDPSVVLGATLEAPRGREGRVEWLNPRGEIFQVSRVTKAAERQECIVKTLPLAGHKAAQEPGEWRVRLFWAELEVFTLKFTVGAAARTAGAPAAAARSGRIAILIDNRRYGKLPAGNSSAADVDALANALRMDAFEVVRVSDATLDNLRLIEHTLDDKLQAGDTALVYYTGYDARSGGDLWMLPVNFDPADSRPMQSKAYSALRLLQWLEDSKAGLRFVFLDGAPAPGQPSENLGAILGEVDDSTALTYSRAPAPGAFGHALAEVLGKPEIDARTALGIELPKAVSRTAPSSTSPVAILGGGADFIFRGAVASGASAKKP
jgi:hypothetical protein